MTPAGDLSAPTVIGIALASALVPLNSTMIAVALPRIADDFDIAKGHAAVLITVYLVAMLVGQPIAGRLSDAVGARRLAVCSLVGFGVCSAAAVVPSSFAVLVVLRAGQAALASALAPSVQAMLRAITAPEQRGRAFGLMGSVIGVGAALGPVVGGAVTGAFGWRAIFAVNLPVVVVVLVVLVRAVPAVHRSATGGEDLPAADAQRLLNRTYVAALSTQALSVVAQYSLLLITPIVLDARGWSSQSIGFALTLLTVGIILMGPLGGRMSDRWGRRLPVVVGLALGGLAVAVSVPRGDEVSPAALLVSLGLFGLGSGLATPSIMIAALEAAPESRIGIAAGVLSMSRYWGSIVASVVLTVAVSDTGRGTGLMLAVALAGCVAGVVAAGLLPGRDEAR